MNRIKYLDLFAGIGGFRTGLTNAGDIFLPVGWCEIDRYAQKAYRALYETEGEYFCDDATKIEPAELPDIDLICAGFPCQPFSVSGRRLGFADTRGTLFHEIVRLAEAKRPSYLLLENVPGLVSLFNGRAKDAIEAEFAALGFKVVHKILRASDYGVPQHRRRVVFIGLREGDFKYPNQEFFEHPAKNQKRMVSCKEALSDLPPLSGATELGEEMQSYVCSPKCEYQRIMRQHSKAVHNHVAAMHSEKVRSIIAMVAPGKNYKSLPEEFRKSRNFHVAWTRFPENEPSPTIDTGHRHHFHYKECRVPTVRECARLQSFPDAFIFTGNKTQQFRQVGNAVPPLMARAIGIALKEALNG